LIDALADKARLRKKDAGMVVDTVLDTIMETVGKGEPVSLVGFGTFDVRARAARTGRNPRTGEQINIPASKACVFRVGRKLREAVEGK